MECMYATVMIFNLNGLILSYHLHIYQHQSRFDGTKWDISFTILQELLCSICAHLLNWEHIEQLLKALQFAATPIES